MRQYLTGMRNYPVVANNKPAELVTNDCLKFEP